MSAKLLKDFFPVGSFRGFRSPSLRAAKTISTGAAEYEYGPVYMTGRFILINRCFISSLVCQVALLRRIVDVSCQPG